MAAAGFYCISDDDLVTCFMCSKQLDGWESEDDPWKEHFKHASYCLYAKLGKTTNELTKIEIFDIKQEQLFLGLDQYATAEIGKIRENVTLVKKRLKKTSKEVINKIESFLL